MSTFKKISVHDLKQGQKVWRGNPKNASNKPEYVRLVDAEKREVRTASTFEAVENERLRYLPYGIRVWVKLKK